MILATAESFDCAVIHLNHTVMSRCDDYAGSDDAGGSGSGSVLVLKHRQEPPVHVHINHQRGRQRWLYPPEREERSHVELKWCFVEKNKKT